MEKTIEELLDEINSDLNIIVLEIMKYFPDLLLEQEDLKQEFLSLKESINISISMLKLRINHAIKSIELICKKLREGKEIENISQNKKILNYSLHVKQMRDYLEAAKKDLENPFKQEIISELNKILEMFYSIHLLFKESIHFYNRIFPKKKLLTLEEALKQILDIKIEYY